MNSNFGSNSGFYRILNVNKFFLVSFILVFTFVGILIGKHGNAGLFLHLNSCNTKTSDYIFLYLTNLGDGVVAFLLVVVLLWVSFREALTFLAITLIITLIINLLKNVFFPELNRPLLYFGNGILHLVHGYQPPMMNTFPSGHSATAFSVGLYLSNLSKKRITQFVLFLGACSVGYSRIYLSAHFPLDVVGGATIGIIVTIIFLYFQPRFKNPWLDRKFKLSPKLFPRHSNL